MVLASSQVSCAAPANTLTFDCDSLCSEYSPCWLNATASATTCSYECYNMYLDPSATTAFIFLVPYGKWKSTYDETATTAAVTTSVGDMNRYIFKSNDYLEHIAALTLPPEKTTVYVQLLSNDSVVL